MQNLPLPSDEDIRRSEQLCEQILQHIVKENGWIDFARYMEQILYAPGLGYYQSQSPIIGAQGDFITAPSCSAWFGYSLAGLIRPVLQQSDSHILECGAGLGHLAADLLVALGDQCTRYSILELSPVLREQQRAMLARRVPEKLGSVTWLDCLPEVFSGCVVANEVLDAMPVHILMCPERTTSNDTSPPSMIELGVGVINSQYKLQNSRSADLNSLPCFGFVPCPPGRESCLKPETLLSLPIPDIPGYRTELGLSALGWISSVSDILQRGAILISDYGFPAPEYYHPQRTQGTLLCHYRHHIHEDPFWMPGLCDVTSHVEFEGVATRAQQQGLQTLYYSTQAQFLMEWGRDILQNMNADNAKAQALLSQQVQYLTSPAQMGDVFKLLLLGRGIRPPVLSNEKKFHR